MAIPVVVLPGRLAGDDKGPRNLSFTIRRRYAEAVQRAGGRVVMLPPIADRLDDLPDVVARFDGLLLHGGGDVDPACYGATERHPELGGVRAEHDAVELAAVRAALDADVPILAICRGLQVLNVALGGTLIQHLEPTSVDHRDTEHAVDVVPGSLLADVCGTTRPSGHSWHHQAVDRLGTGLVASARADDGVIEAIELPGRWVLGVQWHPEDTADTDPVNQRLFDRFVDACRGR